MGKLEQTQKNYSLKGRLVAKKHLWMILYVPLYLAAFVLLQTREVNYTTVYIPLDSIIPFVEYFALAYWAWYFLMIGIGVYLLIRDEAGFRNFMLFMMIGFSLCLATYWLYPTGQHLRPNVFLRENIFSRAMGFIYSVDPSINVLPSMHAVGSFMCAAALISSPTIKKKGIKFMWGVLGLLCAISTVFVKQHSLLDVIASVGICIPIFIGIYAPWTRARRRELSPPCQVRWLLFGIFGGLVSLLCLWYVVTVLTAFN